MKNFTFNRVINLDSVNGNAIYLPTSINDCQEIFSLYNETKKSKMIKGSRTITGDHEVEHHKCSILSAPLCPDAVEKIASSGSWEHTQVIRKGLAVNGLWCYAPGATAQIERKFCTVTGTVRWQYKPHYERTYFYALTPYIYIYHRYVYMADRWGDSSYSRVGDLRHEAYIFYLGYKSSSYPNMWRYASRKSTPGHQQQMDVSDWAFVDAHRNQFDKQALKEFSSLQKISNKSDYIHPGLNSIYEITFALDLAAVDFDISQSLFSAPPTLLTEEEFGDLCQAAVDNINYVDINTVAYLKDLKDFGSELQAIAKLVSNPTNPKAWANLFLNYNYGSRLTIADTFKLINGIINCSRTIVKARKKAWRTCRARKSSTVVHPTLGCQGNRLSNYKVYYKPYDQGVMSFVHKMAAWDLLPTAANLWDFMPYSFVVDWFVDIGGMLESIDSAAQATSLDVVGVLYSTKDTYQLNFDLPGQQVLGATYTVYARRWSRRLHPPPPRLEASDGFLHNIPQLLAILIQRK